MFEQELRDIAFVPRWVIARTINKQTVDGHSYFVVLYTRQLCEWLGLARHNTLMCVDYAMWHDQIEGVTGDIPGPAKRSIIDEARASVFAYEQMEDRFGDDWKQPTTDGFTRDMVKAIVKVADLMDECFFMATEIQMGNRINAWPILEASSQRLVMAIDALHISADRRADLRCLIFKAITNAHTRHPKWPVNNTDMETGK